MTDLLTTDLFDNPLSRRMEAMHAAGITWLETLRATRIERCRAMLPEDRIHRPIVYYMRMDGLVKIGTTTRISQRLRALTPQGVLAVEWGGHELERAQHNRFASHHSHGEWFWLRKPIWAHIAELRAARFRGSLSMDEWLALLDDQACLTIALRPALLTPSGSCCPSSGGVMYDLDAKLPAHLAARLVGVSRQLINYWRTAGKLKPVGTKGRSPLYRLGDLLDVERDMRQSSQSHRSA